MFLSKSSCVSLEQDNFQDLPNGQRMTGWWLWEKWLPTADLFEQPKQQPRDYTVFALGWGFYAEVSRFFIWEGLMALILFHREKVRQSHLLKITQLRPRTNCSDDCSQAWTERDERRGSSRWSTAKHWLMGEEGRWGIHGRLPSWVSSQVWSNETKIAVAI